MPRTKLPRRVLLQLLPALSATAGAQPPAQTPAPQRVSKEMLAQALATIGLEFPDAQLTMMLTGVNRALTGYEALRKVDVPLDTEPAIHFTTLLPGKKPPAGPGQFRLSKTAAASKPRSFTSLEDLAFLPVTELAPLVRTKRVSPVDLTKMYLERLKRHAPKLLCVITLTEDLALEQARAAERDIRAGRYRGPLHGIPWGAKDLFATKGIRTTWGAEPYQDQIPTYDATVVERLAQAGAVLVAKLSLGALAQGGLWFGGMTKTPWDTEQSSSGSSAGSASATAAGLVGFSLGTETLGSIISPSVRCGVAGLRPTYGRVSRYGAMSLSSTMDKVGPICRSVEDCALVLRAIAGPDGRDATAVDAAFDWTPDAPLERLRIGYASVEFEKAGAQQKPVYDQALEALRKAGAKLVDVKLPEYPANALRGILTAEAAAAFDDLTRSGGVNKLRAQGASDWGNVFRTSRLIPAVEYLRAQRARTLVMRQMEQFMADWDVIVTPTGSASLSLTNLTGHPQIVVPCGFVGKLPLGLLFTGRLFEEGAPMRAAMAYEQSTEWRQRHPKLDS